jgi:hypothetical protein
MMSGRQYSRMETYSGVVILLCLLFVALGVFFQQYSFNPAVLVVRNAGLQVAQVSKLQSDFASLPPELEPFGRPETFTADNLYDKIDGKAELYLAAGFVQLRCQRFALKDTPSQWLEWFVYDMGGLPQAFSVFSVQRRAEGQPLDLAEFAYQTKNALYFVTGDNYIEAIASSSSDSLMKAMRALAARCVAANPVSDAHLAGLKLLPTENLVPGGYTLQSADAFGFNQFKNVFTAKYLLNDAEVMAFVTVCSNPETATALDEAYRSFLMTNGGKPVELQTSGAIGKAIEIMGTFEIIFSESNIVAGVHAAPALAPAEQLSKRLHERLAQRQKSR